MQYVEQNTDLHGKPALLLVSLFPDVDADGNPYHVVHRRPTSEAEIKDRLTQKTIVYDGSDHRIQDGKLLDAWQMSKP